MTRRVLAVIIAVLVLGLVGTRFLSGPAPEELLGLWEVGTPQKIGDPLRFYYFHTGGKGLYRYGQVGLNQTRSYDWSISGDVLTLHFRKSGHTTRTRFAIETREGHKELVLVDDPRNGGSARYRHRPAQLQLDDAEPAMDVGGPLALDGTGLERMWIDHQRFATGGQGFVMYQLSKHTLAPHRKLGWFHAGDFDDWSTETLAYGLGPSTLSLEFALRGDSASTAITTDGKSLTLASDPRDFGARHRYSDGGPSF